MSQNEIASEVASVAQIMAALQSAQWAQAERMATQYLAEVQTKHVSVHEQADAYHLRGMARRELGRLAEALQDMRHAAEMDEGNAMLWLHIAQIEQRLDENASALASLHRATVLQPSLEEAWFRKAAILLQQHAWQAAHDAYARLLTLPGVSPEIRLMAHNSLGIALRRLEQWEASMAQFSLALQLDPSMLEARLNLAESLRQHNQPQAALTELQRCVREHPHAAEAQLALSELLAERDAPAALAALRRAIDLEPSYRLRFARRLHRLQRQLCDWTDFDASCASVIQSAQQSGDELGDLFITLSVPGFDRALQSRSATRWADLLKHEATGLTHKLANGLAHELVHFPAAKTAERPKERHGRIRIGYLSADLHTHPTAWLMAEIFEQHDRQRFEVFAYSLGPDDQSPMRQRLEKAFEHFRDVRGLALAPIEAQIRSDQLDILVDLKGYTQDARPEILALRPAPIQVNYLGYPGTMGADFMDYILADEIVLPVEHQADYGEKAVYLPWSYQCNDRQRAVGLIPARKEVGLPDNALVLCCFNTSYKLTPQFFTRWCTLLKALPHSVLWILDGGDDVRRHLLAFAQKQGVAPAQLVFAPKLPHAEHLARLSLADLFLDTLPYNAHTTASDALWVGVPVVTCMGDTFAGRVAASLLHAVGLDELVTHSLDDYSALILRLAHEPNECARLRQHLQHERLRCPLFDSMSFTRNLETAYQHMWERHQQGLPPGTLS